MEAAQQLWLCVASWPTPRSRQLEIRAIVSDDMAEEANWVFDSATQLFQQLMELGLERTLEPSDAVSE